MDSPGGTAPHALRARLGIPRRAIVAIVLTSLVSNVLILTGPMFMLQVYDRVLASRSVPTLVALITLVAALYAFMTLIEAMRLRVMVRIAGLVDHALALPALQSASLQSLVQKGRVSGEPVRDLDSLRQYLTGNGPLTLLDLPWLPVYLAIIFLLHPLLGWVATLGAVVILALLVGNEVLALSPARGATLAAMGRERQMRDLVENAESVFALGMFDALGRRWRQTGDDLLSAQIAGADRGAVFTAGTKSFRLFLQSAVLATGAYLALQNQISAGLMIAASIITSRALAPVEQVVGHWRSHLSTWLAVKRLRKDLNIAPISDPQTLLPTPSRSLAAIHLSTGPAGEERLTVDDITFRLEAGDGMAIVGPSGSGKSSIVRALVGVWPARRGFVQIDEERRSRFSAAQLARTTGYLPQNIELFDGTVAENISRFDPEAPSDRIIRAAEAAGVAPLVAALPRGYDTPIGRGGSILSMGQRQRLGLARALYGDPFLIVLDEPNANLDEDGDRALTAAIRAARQRGAVVVIVAHRPSAVEAVDKLLYVRDGHQMAFGPKSDFSAPRAEAPRMEGRKHG